MKNGTENKKVVFDIIFNLICMIYIIYSWMSLTNVGVVTALTHNHGDAMLLIFGAAIVLIVFFIIDIISLISGKKQRGYLLPGYYSWFWHMYLILESRDLPLAASSKHMTYKIWLAYILSGYMPATFQSPFTNILFIIHHQKHRFDCYHFVILFFLDDYTGIQRLQIFFQNLQCFRDISRTPLFHNFLHSL